MSESAAAQPLQQTRRGGELAERSGIVGWVVPGDEEAGHRVAHGGAQPARRRGHNRRTARLSFDRHQPERLRMGRHDDHRRCPVPIGELTLRARWFEAHPVGQAEPAGQRAQLVGVGSAGPARPAHERDLEPAGEARVICDHHGRRVQ